MRNVSSHALPFLVERKNRRYISSPSINCHGRVYFAKENMISIIITRKGYIPSQEMEEWDGWMRSGFLLM